MTHSETDRLIDVTLDDGGLPPPTPEIEQERRVALFDLREENVFRLPSGAGETPPPGPYRLALSVRDGRLRFDVADGHGAPAHEFALSLTPLRPVIKEYFALCDSYFEAVKRMPADRIEALDAERRSLHDEGSALLRERLEGKIEIDAATARRLFTLVCVLHFKG